jgi:hypothetical protein
LTDSSQSPERVCYVFVLCLRFCVCDREPVNVGCTRDLWSPADLRPLHHQGAPRGERRQTFPANKDSDQIEVVKQEATKRTRKKKKKRKDGRTIDVEDTGAPAK